MPPDTDDASTDTTASTNTNHSDRGPDFASQREQIESIEANRPDPDPDYDPTGKERVFLAILREEHRAPTGLVRKRGGFDMNYCSQMAKRLADHGYIWRVVRPNESNYGDPEEITGFYEYNAADTPLDADLEREFGSPSA